MMIIMYVHFKYSFLFIIHCYKLYVDTKVKNIYPVVSPVKQLPLESNSTYTPPPISTTNSSNAGGPPSMQARLMAIMSQVEIANESVQKAVSAGALGQVMNTNMSNNNNAAAADGRNPSSMLDRLKNEAESKHMSRMNSKVVDGERGSGGDVKSSVMIDNRNGKGYIATPQDDKHSDGYDYGRDGDDHDAIIDESIDHADTDLEDTLSNWLIQQRRGVTKRKKHLAKEVHSNLEAALNISCEDAETVEEEEGMQGYQTQTKPMMMMRLQGDRERSSGGGGGSSSGGDGDDAVGDDPIIEDEEINSSKYLSNGDNDVVDLQCMLAQALMAEDDED